ncbi:phospholipase, partial [Mannheimia haemolytica]
MLKKSLLCMLLISSALYAEDRVQENQLTNITLLAEITAQGQKINGVALEYPDNVLSGSDLRQLYQVKTALDSAEK